MRGFVVSLVIAMGYLQLAQAEQPSGSVKIAAVQVSGYDKGDLPRSGYDPTTALVPYIDRAGREGAQLIVFPEYVLGHVRVPGPMTDKIAAAEAAHHIYVVIGGWEDDPDGKYSDVALLFDRQGKLQGKYSKTHAAVDHYEGEPPWSKPPGGKDRTWFLENDPEWTMRRGADFPVFDLDFGRVGIEICYDGWFPEPARILSLKGAELIVWINGRPGLVEDYIVKSVMFQSQVAMVTANQAYGGGTMIADMGQGEPQILERLPEKKEGMIVAAVDVNQIRKARANSRNFQQRRPDLYRELTAPVRTKY